jgi:diadenosine tetraphosphatase ApaH/serine/threonine PP2A family protein phosphatase
MHTYIIGDIHGCVKDLACLLEQLPLDCGDRIVFLGDYIDRGPDSCGVVSYLLDLRKSNSYELVFLKGNHEDMLLSYLGLGGQHGEMFFYNGGLATLASYGFSSENLTKEHVLGSLPPEHVSFYEELQAYYVVSRYLCVHAGIHPVKDLTEQSEEEMLWIRNKFIYSSHNLPYTVVFGHTPQPDVLFDLPYKIGLDTGLVYGNKLSCLEVEEKILYQLTRGKKNIQSSPVQQKWDAPSRPPMP